MEAVKILGIDILRDQPFREYQLLEIEQANRPSGQQANSTRDFNTQQFLQILTSPQTVVITEKLATRRNYPLGSEMRLMIGRTVVTSQVVKPATSPETMLNVLVRQLGTDARSMPP